MNYLIIFITPGFHTLTATLRYIELISSSVLGTLISHPTHTLSFNKNINSRVAFNFLQHCRQHPRTDKEREKQLPLRKQDVPTHTSALSRLRPPNKIKFFQNTIWGNRKLGGHPKLFQPFDHPFIYVFISFHKQGWFQVKQAFCKLIQ